MRASHNSEVRSPCCPSRRDLRPRDGAGQAGMDRDRDRTSTPDPNDPPAGPPGGSASEGRTTAANLGVTKPVIGSGRKDTPRPCLFAGRALSGTVAWDGGGPSRQPCSSVSSPSGPGRGRRRPSSPGSRTSPTSRGWAISRSMRWSRTGTATSCSVPRPASTVMTAAASAPTTQTRCRPPTSSSWSWTNPAGSGSSRSTASMSGPGAHCTGSIPDRPRSG